MSPRSRSRGITGIRESKRRQTGMAQPLSIQPVSCWASATTARGGAKDKQRNPQATVSEVGARMSGNNTATDIELANSQPCSRSSSETKEVRAKGGRYNEQAAFLNVVLSMVKDKDLEHVTFDEGKRDIYKRGLDILMQNGMYVRDHVPKDSERVPEVWLCAIYELLFCVLPSPTPLRHLSCHASLL